MQLNAVERRLVELQQHWQVFRADDTKRMLIWQTPDNARRLMECFFEAQRHAASEERPYIGCDTFIVFDTPFEDSIRYSRTLKETLAGQYEASHTAIEQAGETADWHFSPKALPDSARSFVEALNDLAKHHPAALGLLVAVMLPSAVNGEAAWNAWLQRALQAEPAPGVRLVVLDAVETPRCNGLAESAHSQLQTENIPIDAWELAGETFAEEPAVGAPGVFRSLLTGLFSLVEQGSPDQVLVKASDAIAFARRLDWTDQEFTVRMLAAGAMLKHRRFEEAVSHYRHARTTARKLIDDDHPAGRELALQSWFGEASAWFANDNPGEAARCYLEAEKVAEAIPKPLLWIESLRMAATCQLRLGQATEAAQCCERALQVGDRMQPEARPMTTLPLVALEALRLQAPEHTAGIETVKQALDTELARLHDEMEQAAARLERADDSGEGLRELEQSSSKNAEHATRAAVRRIDHLVDQAEPRFVETLQRVRRLLWPAWPLDPIEVEAAQADELAHSEASRS